VRIAMGEDDDFAGPESGALTIFQPDKSTPLREQMKDDHVFGIGRQKMRDSL
jgi:hypothetical protein